MQDTVTRFVNEKQNGLMLFEMPTGSGKTYQARKIIGKYIKGEILQNVPTIFYVSPLIKNVDDIYSELREDFKNGLETFDANVLRLYPNAECVIKFLCNIEDKIPFFITNKQSYKELKQQVDLYNQVSDYGKVRNSTTEAYLNNIRKTYEPPFRRDLVIEINKNCRTKRERKKRLQSKEFSWVKELYPSCMTDDRKVIIMTMSKFIAVNDPIIDKTYRFISSSKTKGALVFLDEFDATKAVVLNQEIERCADFKLNLIKLFQQLSSNLNTMKDPMAILVGSNDSTDIESPLYAYTQMKKVILETQQECNLDYRFKLEANDERDKCFLFDDFSIHTISTSDKNKRISICTNDRTNHIAISFVAKGEKGNFNRLIQQLKGAINYFIKCCAMISRDYLIHSIISILLPWYPQTLASEQKQLNAIQLLVKEYPDIGWEVLKGLLPNSTTSMATPTVKPKFLNIVIPEKVDVNNKQLYCVYDLYFSLALKIASSDEQKISELIGCISYVGAEAIRKFLTTVQKYSDTWTDSQRLKVWLELSDYKYDVIFQNNNTEPESELFSSLCDTITKLTPEDCFSKNKRLFLCDNNEFTLRMDDDNYWHKLTEAKRLAVKEVLETYGIEGVYRFGNETGKGNEIFYDLGRLLKIEELSTVLAKYSNGGFSPDFVYNTIEGFIIVNGIASLEKIGLQNYGVELTVNILTKIRYFSDGLLKVVHNLLSANEDLFWGKYSIPVYYYSDCDYDIQYVVDKFIKNGRFNFLANMLGKGRDVAPIKEKVVYEILEKAATTKQSDSLDPYAVQHLIKRLQDSENRDIDRLSGIELFYLPWLDIHSRTHPRALKTKIAESPEFFCQIIELTFKKHNSDDYIKVNEAAAQRLVQIVFRFDVVPGTDWNGIFNADKFKSWIDYVIDWSLKNDRETVTKQTIGNGLSYAKPLDNDVIDEEIIKVLDAKENAEMRKGYQVGMFNQRGVYIVDPEGKPEKALAAKFERMADNVEKMGYSRFSDTLRDIAQNYLYEAEHNIQTEKLRKGTDD